MIEGGPFRENSGAEIGSDGLIRVRDFYWVTGDYETALFDLALPQKNDLLPGSDPTLDLRVASKRAVQIPHPSWSGVEIEYVQGGGLPLSGGEPQEDAAIPDDPTQFELATQERTEHTRLGWGSVGANGDILINPQLIGDKGEGTDVLTSGEVLTYTYNVTHAAYAARIDGWRDARNKVNIANFLGALPRRVLYHGFVARFVVAAKVINVVHRFEVAPDKQRPLGQLISGWDIFWSHVNEEDGTIGDFVSNTVYLYRGIDFSGIFL